MEDILIIILTLTFTILAAVSKSRKKKREVSTPSGEPDIWDILLPGREPAEAGHSVHAPEPEELLPQTLIPEPEIRRVPNPVMHGRSQDERDSSLRSRKLSADFPGSLLPERGTIKKSPAGSMVTHDYFSDEGDFAREGMRNEIIMDALSKAGFKEEIPLPSVLEDFSLRKAIIYRELLDPKYF